jgi:hypothetical protein
MDQFLEHLPEAIRGGLADPRRWPSNHRQRVNSLTNFGIADSFDYPTVFTPNSIKRLVTAYWLPLFMSFRQVSRNSNPKPL